MGEIFRAVVVVVVATHLHVAKRAVQVHAIAPQESGARRHAICVTYVVAHGASIPTQAANRGTLSDGGTTTTTSGRSLSRRTCAAPSCSMAARLCAHSAQEGRAKADLVAKVGKTASIAPRAFAGAHEKSARTSRRWGLGGFTLFVGFQPRLGLRG
jgi:hypothetical protein